MNREDHIRVANYLMYEIVQGWLTLDHVVVRSMLNAVEVHMKMAHGLKEGGVAGDASSSGT